MYQKCLIGVLQHHSAKKHNNYFLVLNRVTTTRNLCFANQYEYNFQVFDIIQKCFSKLHGYTVHQTLLKPFYYQLMHIMLTTQSY